MNNSFASRLLLLIAIIAFVPFARAAQTNLSAEQKAAHALNRLGFGARPGEVQRVAKMGVEKWIEAQLHPENIDDPGIAARLKPLVTLNYSPYQLMLAYDMDKANFVKRAVQKQQEALKKQGASPAEIQAVKKNNRTLTPELRALLGDKERQLLDEAQKNNILPNDSVRAVGELQQERFIRASHSNRQLQEVLVDFWSNHFNLDVKKGPVRSLKIVDEHEVIRPYVFAHFRDLLGASAKSPAMMAYLDNARSTVEVKISSREQERLRQRMQKRLARNANGEKGDPGEVAMPEMPETRGGLNENYGRELMELHTLGVDGGYTQNDVREVARCFTGWGLNQKTGEFQFRSQAHDNGEKTVMGHKISAGGGIRDGEMVLDILASHPATARHIAKKLCMRFIADEPPVSIVDKAAQTFTRTSGDLREVMKTILLSPEFFAASAYRAKIKSPFEYAVSAVRALGGEVDPASADLKIGGRLAKGRGGKRGAGAGAGDVARVRLLALADGASSVRPDANNRGFKTLALEIAAMGQPLFSYQAPTGYPEDSSQWVSTGALVARLNYALALTGGQVQGVKIPQRETTDLDALLQQLIGGEVSAGTRQTLQEQIKADNNPDAAKIAALIIGSPEFQRK